MENETLDEMLQRLSMECIAEQKRLNATESGTEQFEEMVEKYPVEMVERAVKGMLPHNRLGRKMINKVRIYAGSEHENQAQKPEIWEVK